jgi:hypothetical protein
MSHHEENLEKLATLPVKELVSQEEESMNLIGIVFNNGQIALTYCPVFGLCVYGQPEGEEPQWLVWNYMNNDDRKIVRKLLDWSPTCPKEWINIIYKN